MAVMVAFPMIQMFVVSEYIRAKPSDTLCCLCPHVLRDVGLLNMLAVVTLRRGVQ